MPAIFITATGTDVGKTYVVCAAIAALRRQGRPVDAYKPALSGYTGLEGSDAALLLAALSRPRTDLDAIAPLRFAAPLAAPSAARAEGRTITLDQLTAACRARVAASKALLLIEGAGGVMSPLAEGATNLDLIAALQTPVLLVAGTYLGAVSHTLTAIEALKARGVAILGVVVSESPDGPPADEILSALKAFAAGLAVVFAPRGADWDAAPLVPLLLDAPRL